MFFIHLAENETAWQPPGDGEVPEQPLDEGEWDQAENDSILLWLQSASDDEALAFARAAHQRAAARATNAAAISASMTKQGRSKRASHPSEARSAPRQGRRNMRFEVEIETPQGRRRIRACQVPSHSICSTKLA